MIRRYIISLFIIYFLGPLSCYSSDNKELVDKDNNNAILVLESKRSGKVLKSFSDKILNKRPQREDYEEMEKQLELEKVSYIVHFNGDKTCMIISCEHNRKILFSLEIVDKL